ncbi:MAG: hypothetical protein ALECFALPRED_008556 [Alectoria fallacina]|uniref:DUF7730 domain-containing protein n=1 Tax=Alectoria fallacina TaxID=1903189 RepID=A0A8H3EFV6_9LECA|nr:MAG: hypothetical protein ALECFALPRED_008556 [Alectoria fallacina]
MHTDRANSASDTCKSTFSFLKLPTEVRAMIYHHHLTSERVVPRHVEVTKRWTPINLLYVNRTVYNEAFFHLYTKGDFILEVRPGSIFGLATCRGTTQTGAIVGLRYFVKSQKILDLIRHIDLEIHWPSVEYSRLMDRDSGRVACTMNDRLKQTMAAVGAMLSALPGLRTIDVSWCHMTISSIELTKAAPPMYKIPVWLRGLKQVRRKNEKVLIRMPLQGSTTTKELAEEQDDRDEFSNLLKEIKEDLLELQGNLKEEYF